MFINDSKTLKMSLQMTQWVNTIILGLVIQPVIGYH